MTRKKRGRIREAREILLAGHHLWELPLGHASVRETTHSFEITTRENPRFFRFFPRSPRKPSVSMASRSELCRAESRAKERPEVEERLFLSLVHGSGRVVRAEGHALHVIPDAAVDESA